MIKYTQKQLKQIQIEVRALRQKIASIKRAWFNQKEKNKKLEEEKKRLEQENKKLEAKLEQKLKDQKDFNDKLKGKIFKPNIQIREQDNTEKRKRGAQKGHKGHSRKLPENIDIKKNVHLTHCPDCNHSIKEVKASYKKIVEDIPPPKKAITTEYTIQKQWCPKCKKAVRAVPINTIEGLRFGTNLITLILYQKYHQRIPLNRIQESLKEQYQLRISQGGIQKILHKVRKRFKGEYKEILEEIRQGKKKHADETSWRNEGQNNWVWLFGNEKAIYYTIEETRGKRIPEKIIGEDPNSVLIRDDYAGYKNLNIKQQSCWAHLLRNSYDGIKQPDVSKEMGALHLELKEIFVRLKTITQRPFDEPEREGLYEYFKKRISTIIERPYENRDAKKIQTRIKNQNERLITALKYDGVPLMNNLAERNIRPLTVIRKISGGSRSDEGAQTTAVNMSIVQTLSMKSLAFFNEIGSILNQNRFALEKE